MQAPLLPSFLHCLSSMKEWKSWRRFNIFTLLSSWLATTYGSLSTSVKVMCYLSILTQQLLNSQANSQANTSTPTSCTLIRTANQAYLSTTERSDLSQQDGYSLQLWCFRQPDLTTRRCKWYLERSGLSQGLPWPFCFFLFRGLDAYIRLSRNRSVSEDKSAKGPQNFLSLCVCYWWENQQYFLLTTKKVSIKTPSYL